jgi:dihydrofolate reductase
MRKLIVAENISVDGVIEALDDWFGPASGGDDVVATEREHYAACDAVLLGRQTYEDFKGYWPLQTDATVGIADSLNRAEKYVVSSTPTESDWEHTTFLTGPLEEEVARLKARAGKDIVTTGSITLVRALLVAGLVDEYRLFVYPVIVGRGRRLFTGGFGSDLRLADTRTFRSGVVLLTYRPTTQGEEAR